ncbi:MAG: hypothetical protein IPL11_19635 [Candidatus Accumulibacter sp.]|nr:hypothetical protein [Accumulibacter sp.]
MPDRAGRPAAIRHYAPAMKTAEARQLADQTAGTAPAATGEHRRQRSATRAWITRGGGR